MATVPERAAQPGMYRVYIIRKQSTRAHPEEFSYFPDAMSCLMRGADRQTAMSVYNDKGDCCGSVGPPHLTEHVGGARGAVNGESET